MFETLNFKDLVLSREDTSKIFELEKERLILSKEKGVKILHGYGSHGRGGAVCLELHKYLLSQKHLGKISNVFFGGDWNIANVDVQHFLLSCPEAAQDEDLNKQNGGITVVEF